MDREQLAEFRRLIAGPPDRVDLFSAAMVIASIGGDGPGREACASELDRIGEAVSEHADGDRDPQALAQAIDFQLFTVLGFRGDGAGYHDPRNSCLDQVVIRRLGIPITLSIVYLEVARRVGLSCAPVGYPGHFLVRAGNGAEAFYIDPFHQGARLDAAELRAQLAGLARPVPRPEYYLAPVTARQVLQRMLNNLRHSFRKQRDVARWRDTVDLSLCLEPWNAGLVGERGMLNYRLGSLGAALEDLEAYVGGVDRGAVAAGALRILGELRNRLDEDGIR